MVAYSSLFQTMGIHLTDIATICAYLSLGLGINGVQITCSIADNYNIDSYD